MAIGVSWSVEIQDGFMDFSLFSTGLLLSSFRCPLGLAERFC